MICPRVRPCGRFAADQAGRGWSPRRFSRRGGFMPNYLSPGVYVEEVEAGSRPIEGVGTAVAAFVGFAGNGPFNEPTLVSNWRQFTSTFGDFIEGAYLAHAVYGYFSNGGGAAYIVRVGQDGAGDSKSKKDMPAIAGPRQVEVGGYRITELES